MELSPWLVFSVSALIIVVVAYKLAEYGDIIAVRTNLGGLVIGTIFLAGATSLPELITSVSAFGVDAPDLAAGNLFGSNMVNMLLLALIDLLNYRVPLIRHMAVTHTLTAVLASLLMLLAVLFLLADIDIAVGWVGLDSLLMIGLYFGGVWLVQQNSRRPAGTPRPQSVAIGDDFPSLKRGIVGFVVSAAILVAIVPQLVKATAEIAAITGLAQSFLGASMLSIVTSLPELLAALAAVRFGAVDLAVGNLFGSSVFNMLGLGLADFFYTEGRFLASINPSFAVVGLLALLLTNLALLANLARIERRLLFIEIDALLIIVGYLGGMYLLFAQGI